MNTTLTSRDLLNAGSPPRNVDAIMTGMLQIGDQFDRFQIRAHLAQGGMADIYRAYDLMNRRDVVLKIPDKMLIGDPAQYERFQRELEIINTLHHPAILHGLGSGQYNRIPYLATEFVQGQSLRDLIATAAPLPPDQAVALVRKIAEGMAYCHANEVIHRDLKPENILITPEGQPIIMDFGLALTQGGRRVTYANLSATAGTPDYMAPEQIEGQRGDPRTDLYALGTMLYEMLAGKVPFTADNNFAVMQAASERRRAAARSNPIGRDAPTRRDCGEVPAAPARRSLSHHAGFHRCTRSSRNRRSGGTRSSGRDHGGRHTVVQILGGKSRWRRGHHHDRDCATRHRSAIRTSSINDQLYSFGW